MWSTAWATTRPELSVLSAAQRAPLTTHCTQGDVRPSSSVIVTLFNFSALMGLQWRPHDPSPTSHSCWSWPLLSAAEPLTRWVLILILILIIIIWSWYWSPSDEPLPRQVQPTLVAPATPPWWGSGTTMSEEGSPLRTGSTVIRGHKGSLSSGRLDDAWVRSAGGMRKKKLVPLWDNIS